MAGEISRAVLSICHPMSPLRLLPLSVPDERDNVIIIDVSGRPAIWPISISSHCLVYFMPNSIRSRSDTHVFGCGESHDRAATGEADNASDGGPTTCQKVR